MAKRPTKKKTKKTRTPRLGDLAPAPYNPRDIDDASFAGLTTSLAEFGDIAGITWNQRTGNLVAGHQRLRSLREKHGEQLRMSRGVIRTPDGETFRVRVVDWPLAKEKAANVAANSPELAGLFTDDIEALVGDVSAAFPELSEDLRFDDLLKTLGVGKIHSAKEPDPGDLPDKAITKPGDVWTLGDHRLACISSTDADAVSTFLDGAVIDFIFTSPPYNIGVEYTEHDDESATRENYIGFLRACVESWTPHLADGRFLGWNIAPVARTHHARQHLMIEDDVGLNFFRQIIWKKVGLPLPSWYHTANNLIARNFTPNYVYEMIMLFSKGKPIRGGVVEGDLLCEYDVFDLAQSQATVDIPAGAKRTGAKSNLETRAFKAHPAPYPIQLPQMFMAHFCDVDGIVADPFMGSGSTMLAAENSGRASVGVELDPRYCDVAIERWQNLTGGKAKRRRRRRKK